MVDILDMSDEDFANYVPEPEVETPAVEVPANEAPALEAVLPGSTPDAPVVAPVIETPATPAVVADDGDDAGDKASEGDASILDLPDDQVEAAIEAAKEAAKKPAEKAADGVTTPAAPDASKPTGEQPAKAVDPLAPVVPPVAPLVVDPAAPVPVDKVASYDQIMAPFKANGRVIEVKTPEEAIRLMQLGANYTKKMQALAPNLKLMQALQNNGLMAQDKVDLIIDVMKGKPEAINTILKSGNVDPLDLDPNANTDYKPTNHSVSDDQMRFNATMEDLRSTPEGQATIKEVSDNWDDQSQQRIYAAPDILNTINSQRENGIYSHVTSEIERLKMLGDIPPGTSFYDSYEAVGAALHKHGLLKINGVPTNQLDGTVPRPPVVVPPAPVVVPPSNPVIEKRAEAPKPLANDARAKAAAPTRTAPIKQPDADFNPLSMSDADFMKLPNFRI